MRITLYGKLGEAIGREIACDELVGCTIAQARRALAERHPQVAPDLLSPRVRACIDNAIVGEEAIIAPGDAVALLPPVSGG